MASIDRDTSAELPWGWERLLARPDFERQPLTSSAFSLIDWEFPFQGKVGNVARLRLLKMETFCPSPCKNTRRVQLWNTNAQTSMSWKDLRLSPALMGSGQAPQFA